MLGTAEKPVISHASYCLAHVPDLVRYGSKPLREIANDAAFDMALSGALRGFEAAVDYPPNQVYIGNLSPESLALAARPWFETPAANAARANCDGPFGEIVPQSLFYAVLKQADVLQPALIDLCSNHAAELAEQLRAHRMLATLDRDRWQTPDHTTVAAEIDCGNALALRDGSELVGCARGDRRGHGRDDRNLDAVTLLEALCTKASAAIALTSLLRRHQIEPDSVDFIITCGEEAVGDRYQRGGGGMAKAVGEMCSCVNASGMDIKNFCAAPASALVTAGALVRCGLFQRVAVVAGGSLAKLGMKSQAFLDGGLPILGDVLASMAFLVTRDDGQGAVLRLHPGAVGIARIGASTANDAVYRQLVLEPLAAMGLTMRDIDKFAPELHNPEIMEHSGSGDVAHKNYRMLGALAVLAGEIDKPGMAAFIDRIGMPGFAPPQGHIPSGVPYIGHAIRAMHDGQIERAMFVCKASLFLNRLTELYDGVSFVLEKNPAASAAYSSQP